MAEALARMKDIQTSSEREGNHTRLKGGLVLVTSEQCIPKVSTSKSDLRIPEPSTVDESSMVSL